MSVQFEEAVAMVPAAAQAPAGAEVQEGPVVDWDPDGWDLDISIVETGPEADRLIQMTDDGCGETCESACSSTCP
ncbi:FxLD family lanthipeptide [Streptomyces venezuelae]|uniref:FxLD family lanthipeptide n=1 Tax=Streptomyces venezuelae TaxID=54571 RepID=UPI003419770A